MKEPGEVVSIQGNRLRTLHIDPTEFAAPFSISFEVAMDRLAQLPGMYCEPDGSFNGTGTVAGTRWQLEGNLYDRDGRLMYVELKGDSPTRMWRELFLLLEAPAEENVIELVEAAVFITGVEFLKLAEGAVED